MLKDGSLQTGEFSLPVMLDPPPPNYLYINPEVMLPGTRWVDNHKGIFNIVIEAITSVHTLVFIIVLFIVFVVPSTLDCRCLGSPFGSLFEYLFCFGRESHRSPYRGS